MSPLLDQLFVGMIVGGAIGFFAVRFFRKKKGGCGSGCGCAKRPTRPD